MESLFKQPVFATSAKQYDWADVILAALLKRGWEEVAAQTRLGLACQMHACWGLAWGEVVAYCQRALLKQKLAERWPAITANVTVHAGEFDQAIKAEAICSGNLTELAYELAGRAALGDAAPAAGTFAGTNLPQLRQALPLDLAAGGLQALSPASYEKKLPHLLRLEAGYQQALAQARAQTGYRAYLLAHAQDWIYYAWQCLWFADLQAAREAALCLREDGVALADFAVETNRPWRAGGGYLHQIESGSSER